jgi:hypothetical protein
VIASSYPFLDVMWTLLVFFAWVIWFWLLITVFGDVFRRRDLSGWGKAAWLIFVIVVPYFGVFIYLIAEHDGMAERLRQVRGDGKRSGRADLQREETARRGSDHAGRVRRAQAEGACDSKLTRLAS